MAGELLNKRVKRFPKPGKRRVASRAKSTQARGEADADDPKKQAEALLAESDARVDKDPAPRSLDDDRVDRRTSDEATPPVDS